MLCPGCGANNSDTSKFCQDCGKRLNPQTAPAAPNHPSSVASVASASAAAAGQLAAPAHATKGVAGDIGYVEGGIVTNVTHIYSAAAPPAEPVRATKTGDLCHGCRRLLKDDYFICRVCNKPNCLAICHSKTRRGVCVSCEETAQRSHPAPSPASTPSTPSTQSTASTPPPATPPAPPNTKSEFEAWTALEKLEAQLKDKPRPRQKAMYVSFTKEWSGAEAAKEAQMALAQVEESERRFDTLIKKTNDAIARRDWPVAEEYLREAESLFPNDPPLVQARRDYDKAAQIAKRSSDGRYVVSNVGLITDTKTKLQWYVGPDQEMDYNAAGQWIAKINKKEIAGGGWRMPIRAELRALYQEGKGELNMDPVFETTGFLVWAEPKDPSLAWIFDFDGGSENWGVPAPLEYCARVFAVRSGR